VTGENIFDLFVHLAARQDAVGEVGTVEIADEDFRFLEIQLVGDVAADLGGGGGGEGVDGYAGEKRFEMGELAIFGTKIVTPMADAVGFIDGEGADVGIAEELMEPISAAAQSTPPAITFASRFAYQAFGGAKEQVQPAIAKVGGDFAALVRRQGRIELCGGDAEGAERIDLILHQGNER
jgi:hypothetical protein